MLRTGACILLSVMLFSSRPVLQLFKLPTLFQHYDEHAGRDPGVSFADFLSMHYWGRDANDKDDDKDRKLPFKENIAVNVHYDVAITFPPTLLRISVLHKQLAYSTLYKDTFAAGYTGSPFRPPQVN